MALLAMSLGLVLLATHLAGNARQPAWSHPARGGVMRGSLAGDCLDPGVPGVPPSTRYWRFLGPLRSLRNVGVRGWLRTRGPLARTSFPAPSGDTLLSAFSSLKQISGAQDKELGFGVPSGPAEPQQEMYGN